MVVNKIITTTGPIDLEIIDATLLAVKEAKNVPETLRKCCYDWWLRSPSRNALIAACVLGGSVCSHYVFESLGVRPALLIENLKSLAIGDKFEFAGYNWTIISETKALCDERIGDSAFREDWGAGDANNYEKSDIKRHVDEWFAKAIKAEGEE